MGKKQPVVSCPSAACGYCKRIVGLLKVGEEWRFSTHPTRNGRQCYNAYGRPEGEILLPPAASREDGTEKG